MDRFHSRAAAPSCLAAFFLSSFVGCAANPLPVPTIWDKLGIPQAAAGIRDSTINRSGNNPNREKKPRLLKIADPANMAPEKPEMIKTAAKIKADKDLKKQKIKAISFLADVNCGCYNKDDSVAKAFIAALEDCDPDVRKAGIEGLSKAAGSCSKCKTGCETTCCTEDIVKKLQDIATGKDETGCFKEPVQENRAAASALIKKCGCPKAKPIEEIPAPFPYEIEEITAPGEEAKIFEGDERNKDLGRRLEGDTSSTKPRNGSASKVAYRVRDSGYLPGAEPVIVSKRTSPRASSSDAISNPDQLIAARVVTNRRQLGELLVELPNVYQLNLGWTMVIVDTAGNHQIGTISEASGRRIVIALEGATSIATDQNDSIRMGLVRTN